MLHFLLVGDRWLIVYKGFCLHERQTGWCAVLVIRTEAPVPSSDLPPQLGALLCGEKHPVMIGLRAGTYVMLLLSIATANSPCHPSETCTSFQANDII